MAAEPRTGKAPAFQWYPGDHQRDTALKACAFESRAVWREMLDLMHDGTPYGHLAAGRVPIDERTLAAMVGLPLARVRKALAELEAREVFSRTPDGVIYSRRMARDHALRETRRAAGAKGGNPLLLARTSASEAPAVDADLDNQRDNRRDNQASNQIPTPAVALLQSASASASALPPPTTAVGGTATAAGGGGGPCTSWSEFAQRTDVHAGRTYAELAAGFLATLADDSTRSECARVSADAILSDTSLTTLARALDAWISAPPAVRTKETWRQHLRGVRYRGIQDTIVAEKRRLAPA